MSSNQGLLLIDEKVLTAKRLAFRNLVRLGFRLFARDDHSELSGLREDCIQQVARISGLQQTQENAVSLAQFLASLPEYFGKVLPDVFPPEKKATLESFLAHVALETKECISIVEDCNSWLLALRNLGADYLGRIVDVPVSMPATALSFDVDDKSMLDGAGAVTKQANGTPGRLIELCFNPVDFSFASYYSTLCVLSHEFWCHALSRIRVHQEISPMPAQEVWGCDPTDLWEEGWMDFVQSLILQSELDAIVGDPLHVAAFVENCPRFAIARNDPSRGQARSFGYRTALHFHRFLQQHFREADHFACLVRLSLEFNTIDCARDIKQDFVDAMSECFDLDPILTGTAESIREYQQALVDQQTRLHSMLAKSGAGTSRIDVILLLKLLKILQ